MCLVKIFMGCSVMKKILFKFISVLTVIIIIVSFSIFSASAVSYASPINIDTYLPEAPCNDNQKCLAVHYKNGGYYLLVYGHDGNENISEVFQISNSGNTLYVNNNSSHVSYVYIYFINLETCDISSPRYYAVTANSIEQVTYSESYVIDAIYPYGLTTQLLTPHSVNYSLQVNWSTRTDNNIATIRNELSQVNSKCQNILTYLKSMDEDTSNIRDRLIYTNTYLGSIDGKMSTVLSKLDEVISLLSNLQSAVPSSQPDMGKLDEQASANEAVDNKLNELQSSVTTDVFDVDYQNNAIPWIWQQVEDLTIRNKKVFGVILSTLSVSLIMFILNKGANA